MIPPSDAISARSALGLGEGQEFERRGVRWTIRNGIARADGLDSENQSHTVEEMQAWCAEAGLRIDRQVVEPAGITIVSTRI